MPGDYGDGDDDRAAKAADADRITKFSEKQLEAELAAQRSKHEADKQKEKASKREIFLVMRVNEQVVSISLLVGDSVTVQNLTEEAAAVFADEDKVFDVLPSIHGLIPLWKAGTAHIAQDIDMVQACDGAPAGQIRFLVDHDEDEEGPPKDWHSKPAQFWAAQPTQLKSRRAKYKPEEASKQAQIDAELARDKAQLEADMAADKVRIEEAARKDQAEKAKALQAAKSGQGGAVRPAAAPPRVTAAAPAPASPACSMDDLLGGTSTPSKGQQAQAQSDSINLMELLGNSSSGVVDTNSPAVAFDLLGGSESSGCEFTMAGTMASSNTPNDGFGAWEGGDDAFGAWANGTSFGDFNEASPRHRSESFPGGLEVFNFDMSTMDHLPPLVLEARLANAPSIAPASFEAHWKAAKQSTKVCLELGEPIDPSRLVLVLQRAALHGIAFKEDKETGYLHAYHMAEECHTKELLLVEIVVQNRLLVNAELKATPSSVEVLQRFERHLRLILYQNVRVKR